MLEDPVIAEWFASISNQLLGAVTAAKDEKQAYRAAVAIQVFGLMRNHFVSFIESGKMAAFQLEQKRRFGVF